MITVDDALARLAEAIKAEGSAKAFCQKHRLARGHVSMVRRRERPISRSILDVLGLEAVTVTEVTYREKAPANAGA